MIYDRAMSEARKHWRDKLESMSFEGHIALDHPRPKDGDQQLSSFQEFFSEDVNSLLQRLTTGKPFLAYTTVLLALQICCHKYSGSRQVTIFSPATSEGGVINLLPISSTLDGELSFKEALLTTKDLLSSAYRYQQYPLSRMFSDMPEERKPTHLPMIASMAGFNEQIPDSECDIVIVFETTKDNTAVTFRFDSRLYDEETISHLFQSLNATLRQGLTAMTIRIIDLDLNDSGKADGAEEVVEVEGAALHRLIETQAAKHPESVAILEGDRVTTYQMLNRHADQLADALREVELAIRKPIVILMDAGAEMVISMLAVMKIGAAFAPVKLLSITDPLADVLKTLDCECIICEPEHVADLQQLRESEANIKYGFTVEYSRSTGDDDAAPLEIKRVWSASPIELAAKSTRDTDNEDGCGIACVLVHGQAQNLSKTSVRHTELVSLFQWLNTRCGIGADDRCLLSPGLGSSEQLYDTLGMLVAGASVEIADASSLKDTSLLIEQLLRPSITVWDLPTPLVQNLLAHLPVLPVDGNGLRGPRNIFLSGEKQCMGLADKLAQYLPNARATGLYAHPSLEIWSTVFHLQHDAVPSNYEAVAIAEPIPGFKHGVVNRDGQTAPRYTKGELQISPFSSTPDSSNEVDTGLSVMLLDGKRMSWLRGNYHRFMKYGCRVELTKIESILCQHEHILAAEVIAIPADLDADNLVVAFVIARPNHMSAETARDFLVLRDNVDLIPDRFILLDEFPLTPEGAIDRDVLLRRFLTAQKPKDDARSVATEKIHTQLKSIWLDVLQLDDINDDESFFTRGGNSLKATLLIARIKDEFSVDLSVQDFFRKPSTAAVAQLIAAESKNVNNRQASSDLKAVSRDKYRVSYPK